MNLQQTKLSIIAYWIILLQLFRTYGTIPLTLRNKKYILKNFRTLAEKLEEKLTINLEN